MKIESLSLKDFMLFDELALRCSPQINIICGSNSTGKTALIKLLYSLTNTWCNIQPKDTKDQIESRLVDKLVHVYRTKEEYVGRLVRRQGNSAEIDMRLSGDKSVKVDFSSRVKNHVNCIFPDVGACDERALPVYLPPKEIISATENFASLYDDYHIAFEETYYDLARLLDRPLKRGKNTDEQNQVLRALSDILRGTTNQSQGKFYLNIAGQGNFEMGLVSEGYRKLATIEYLIRNGSLNPDAILFWDEPETNMNPKMIRPLVEAVMALAKMGMQVFITTHDYFVQQYFNLYTAYPEQNEAGLDIRFYSLWVTEDNHVRCGSAAELDDLEHNAIMEEFDAVYDREQEFIDERIGERDRAV